MSAVAPLPPASRAVRALSDALRREIGADAVDDAGYASRLEDSLLQPLSVENVATIRREFKTGAGGELTGDRAKLHAAHSSAALAVNAFARWRDRELDLADLSLAGKTGFVSLAFEYRCPSGLRGVPPHLDVLAPTLDGVVAVESKCTEYLTPPRSSFRPVYEARMRDLAHPSWYAKFSALSASPSAYRYLNAPQLVKHYLGLKNTLAGEQVTLVYLYWEPRDADRHDAFAEHRREIQDFEDGLADPELRFTALSYGKLWDEWEAAEEPAWLAAHVAALRRRYDVELGA